MTTGSNICFAEGLGHHEHCPSVFENVPIVILDEGDDIFVHFFDKS